MKRRGHFICIGRVQGVFFRVSARMEAQLLGLTGWVKNLQDGSVEAVAEGDLEAIDNLYRWCQIGPPNAHVTNVEKLYSAATGEFNEFAVLL
jgi:acylphosphatase